MVTVCWSAWFAAEVSFVAAKISTLPPAAGASAQLPIQKRLVSALPRCTV